MDVGICYNVIVENVCLEGMFCCFNNIICVKVVKLIEYYVK